MDYRPATVQDVAAIAALHADSWRRNYRGAYSDAYLDDEVDAERLAVWSDRLTSPCANDYTVVAARDATLLGFAHLVLDKDPAWGALLDNLHVAHDLKGSGVGTRLMSETARVLVGRRGSPALYLWVLQQNLAAQAFYDARGGHVVERIEVGPDAGGTTPIGVLRYAWPNPAELVRPD